MKKCSLDGTFNYPAPAHWRFVYFMNDSNVKGAYRRFASYRTIDCRFSMITHIPQKMLDRFRSQKVSQLLRHIIVYL